jgi:hypothetical protein
MAFYLSRIISKLYRHIAILLRISVNIPWIKYIAYAELSNIITDPT